MLIEFTVKNFRSIRDSQTFSMVASADDALIDNITTSQIKGSPSLLRAAAIYGPNASGKSNLLKAMHFAQSIVTDGPRAGEEMGREPFMLDEASQNESSEFEFIFIHEEIRYQYGFVISTGEVISEWLFTFPEGRSRELFQRENQEFQFGGHFKGQKKAIEESTRNNALFLSTGVQLNNQQLSQVYDWFAHQLIVIPNRSEFPQYLARYTVAASSNKEKKEKISHFLKAADVGIESFYIDDDTINEDNMPDDLTEEERAKYDGVKIAKPYFLHPVKNTDYFMAFDFDMESDGTKNFFALAGPWLDMLKSGAVLLIDEIEASLHPHLVHFLVGLLFGNKTNPENAQLIFTTHETSIMKKGFMRRDQFWFVEKNKEFSSELIPLSDFSPRKGEAIQKGYLDGKYGAIPFLGKIS